MWKYFSDEKPSDGEFVLFAYKEKNENLSMWYGRFLEKYTHTVKDTFRRWWRCADDDEKDGILYVHEGVYDNYYHTRYTDAYAWHRWPQTADTGWVSFAERRPENGEYIFFIKDGEETWVGEYISKGTLTADEWSDENEEREFATDFIGGKHFVQEGVYALSIVHESDRKYIPSVKKWMPIPDEPEYRR